MTFAVSSSATQRGIEQRILRLSVRDRQKIKRWRRADEEFQANYRRNHPEPRQEPIAFDEAYIEPRKNAWTEAEEGHLRGLIQLGLSAEECRHKLHSFGYDKRSRCAILGKANRLGMSLGRLNAAERQNEDWV